MLHQPPTSPLFPYTTLFRSEEIGNEMVDQRQVRDERDALGRSQFSKGCVDFGDWCLATLRKLRSAESVRSEEHTSELQSRQYLVCRLLLEKKKNYNDHRT